MKNRPFPPSQTALFCRPLK